MFSRDGYEGMIEKSINLDYRYECLRTNSISRLNLAGGWNEGFLATNRTWVSGC